MSEEAGGIPELRLQSLAVDFIDTRLSRYHPGFTHPRVQYDPLLGKYVSTPKSELMDLEESSTQGDPEIGYGLPRPSGSDVLAMRFWHSIFREAMKRFQKTRELIGSDYLPTSEYSIQHALGWGDVYDRLESARNYYLSDENIKGKVKNKIRKAADNIQPVIELVNAIPDIDYVTPILGAVKYLLEAVQTAAERRNEVLGGFDTLYIQFSNVELFLATFPEDQNIKNGSIELIVSILNAIERTIAFYRSTTVSQQLVDFQKEAMVKQNQDSEAAKSSHKQIKEAVTEMAHVIADALTLIKSVLGAYIFDRANLVQGALDTRDKSELASPPEELMSIEQILAWLHVRGLDTDDMEYIDTRQEGLPPVDRARAEQILSTKKFSDWVISPTSTMLLVQGDLDGTPEMSALSVLCLTFTKALRAMGNFISLVFFCGRHLDNTTNRSGGRAIIQSLITQLLTQFSIDTTGLGTNIDGDKIKNGHVEELCKLFAWLFGRLSRHETLFCILDSIVYYERQEYQEDMSVVLASILRLVDESAKSNSTTAACIKVLILSPRPTLRVRKPFDKRGLVLSMDSMPPAESEPSSSRIFAVTSRALRFVMTSLDEFLSAITTGVERIDKILTGMGYNDETGTFAQVWIMRMELLITPLQESVEDVTMARLTFDIIHYMAARWEETRNRMYQKALANVAPMGSISTAAAQPGLFVDFQSRSSDSFSQVPGSSSNGMTTLLPNATATAYDTIHIDGLSKDERRQFLWEGQSRTVAAMQSASDTVTMSFPSELPSFFILFLDGPTTVKERVRLIECLKKSYQDVMVSSEVVSVAKQRSISWVQQLTRLSGRRRQVTELPSQEDLL
ncbi:hypothetical protein O1611_g3477 [Lasiodiplodia mahajangana]|uniref:Uncharacterized protein n=1 Tax=Lasiodiplodia mahajangana TaxID=1108764 RepID=A0ACC2JRX2_9PEZI|nr:hypothetical protein O1611_g3477 [Lasiodiplodia mahajangana]